jgi:hypothetical protein
MRIVTDFRKLNFFETDMSPITYSKDWGMKMIRSMEGFTFAKALDLNMGYYHINLDAGYVKLYSHGKR